MLSFAVKALFGGTFDDIGCILAQCSMDLSS